MDDVTRGGMWAVLDKPGVELDHIVLTFRIHRDHETSQYVAMCDELDVGSGGSDIDEAINAVLDGTLLYLNALEESGDRRRVFAEQGIDPHLGLPGIAADEPAGHSGSGKVLVQPNETVTKRVLVQAGV